MGTVTAAPSLAFGSASEKEADVVNTVQVIRWLPFVLFFSFTCETSLLKASCVVAGSCRCGLLGFLTVRSQLISTKACTHQLRRPSQQTRQTL